MTSSCQLGARRKGCLSLRLFLYSLSKPPPELFITRTFWPRRICPHPRVWQRGAGDTALAWEPHFRPQEVSSDEVFLCQPSSVFSSLGRTNWHAHGRRGSPQGLRPPCRGHGVEGSSPGQQLGASFCQPCGVPTGVLCLAERRPGLEDLSLSPRGLLATHLAQDILKAFE